MKQQLFALLLGAFVLSLSATTLLAQHGRNCAPRNVVVERLADGYGESRQSIGIAGRGSVVEVFASTETGTWTITETSPNGMTCLVASGQSFETLAEVLPTQDKDA